MLQRPVGPVAQAYVSAVMHAQGGRWRRAADAYLKCYLLPACAAWEGSALVLDGFTSIVRDGRLPAAQTVTYIKALKRIARDEARPLLDRVKAYFARGLAKWDAGSRDEAATDYRGAMQLAATATSADRSGLVWRHQNVAGPEQVSVSDEVDRIAEQARDNLSVLTGQSDGDMAALAAAAAAEGALRGTLNPVRNVGGGAFVLSDADAGSNEAALKDAMARLSVGGDRCDQCGVEPPETKPLKMCGRCRMAFYCSKDCAKAAWRGGHKQACRAPGQFNVGDQVVVRGLVGRSELNGSIVVVRGELSEGRIPTGPIGSENEDGGFSIKPSNLRRLRPSA
jgi:hypothetical protein